MRVYWESNRAQKGMPGRKQCVDWLFDYAGKLRCIPAIYRFPEGIVFDLLTFLDETELRLFYDKYRNAEESMSPARRRAAEDGHPYQSVPLAKIKINGRQPSQWSSAGGFHIPWLEDEHSILIGEAKAYARQLNGATCFARDRYMIPLHSEPFLKWECFRRWLCPEKISTIEIEVGKKTRFLPLELPFSLPYDFSGIHTETFPHPQTQVLHTLYFQSMEHEEVQIPIGNIEKTLYITQLSYAISPELPEGDCFQFNSGIEWEPEPMAEGGFLPASSAAIGIIGGSSGPTAIFLAGKNDTDIPHGTHDLPLHTCFAKPSITKEQTVNVILDGINTRWLEERTFSWKSL